MILILFGGEDSARLRLAREVANRSRTFHIPSDMLAFPEADAARTALAIARHNAELHKDVIIDLPSSDMFADKDRYDIVMGDLDGVSEEGCAGSVVFASMPGEQPDPLFNAIPVPEGELVSVAFDLIAKSDLLAIH